MDTKYHPHVLKWKHMPARTSPHIRTHARTHTHAHTHTHTNAHTHTHTHTHTHYILLTYHVSVMPEMELSGKLVK